jgi:hypothetical protein
VRQLSLIEDLISNRGLGYNKVTRKETRGMSDEVPIPNAEAGIGTPTSIRR